MAKTIHLKGMTWDHPRGYDPLAATAREYARTHPGVRIEWEKRPLQAFADHPLDELARRYDLIVMDHPHAGFAARNGCLAPLDTVAPPGAMKTLAEESLGVSHTSYGYDGHQWALAIDAATQVAAWRPGKLKRVPSRWSEVVELAKEGGVLWPVKPVDALMSFFTLAANRGTPCARTKERFLDPQDGEAVLLAMRELMRHVPAECLSMNPIQTLDRLGAEDRWVYCPLLYGYSNYARDGFRKHLVRFANIPCLGNDGPKGSCIGGTGIAISAFTRHPAVAAGYAFWIAGADCQRKLYVQSGGQPGNAVAWRDSEANRLCHNFFFDTLETLERAWLRPRYDGYLTLQDKGGDAVNDFLAGKADVPETLRRLETLYQKTLP